MEEISKRDNKKTEGLLTRDSVDFNVSMSSFNIQTKSNYYTRSGIKWRNKFIIFSIFIILFLLLILFALIIVILIKTYYFD